MSETFVITHPKIFTVLRRARALLHAECLARRPGCGGPRHVEADAVQHGDGRVRGLRGADEEVLHVLQTEIMIMIFNMIIIFIIINDHLDPHLEPYHHHHAGHGHTGVVVVYPVVLVKVDLVSEC